MLINKEQQSPLKTFSASVNNLIQFPLGLDLAVVLCDAYYAENVYCSLSTIVKLVMALR